MTVHWIDYDTLERKSATIACTHMSERHTQDRIASVLESLFADFGITEKNLATITDNGANFVAEFK